MEKQVCLIRKFFKLADDESLLIHGSVDSNDDKTREYMKDEWIRLGVVPYNLPKHRSACASTSYAIAFQFVYDTFIKNNDYISIFMENDIFPISDIEIKNFVGDYALCADVRIAHIFGTTMIPQVWLGLLFFNHKTFADKDLFSGLKNRIMCQNGLSFISDSGGESYYWICKNKDSIKCITQPYQATDRDHFNDHPGLDPYNNPNCKMIDFLPDMLKDGYDEEFRIENYDNKFIHLLSYLGNKTFIKKDKWFENIYNMLLT